MRQDDPSGPEDLLARLEARLDRAAEAAERLIGEATREAKRDATRTPEDPSADATTPDDGEPPPTDERPPPAGWQTRRSAEQTPGDLELLLQVIGSLRERVPSDLQRRLAEALRELLLALRALIDWYLERAERHRREPVEVQDIPIL